MVPKLHKKGTSFKGAAAYLLHDKGSRETNGRVEWTETRNLATANPDAAWRVMAATAMDGDRRKKVAGVKSTGRKSKDSVLHLTLSWHPDEAQGLDRQEMLRAADGAMKALGAGDRQAVFVCHNDEPHPHVHLLINRVSADDGRMLSSSKEKLALSAWAQDYEKERGRVVCPVRVENNARRRRGEFVRGTPDESRQVVENPIKAEQPKTIEAGKRLHAAERAKDAALARQQREMHARHRQEWVTIKERHQAEKATIRHKVRELFPRYKLVIEKKFISWQDSFEQKQRRQFSDFAAREKQLLGRFVNGFKAMDFKGLLNNQNGERLMLRDAFKFLVSSSARMDAFKAQVRRERQEAKKKHNEQAFKVRGRIFAGWRVRRVRVHATFGQQRRELYLRQEHERAEMMGLWESRHAERAHNTKTISTLDRMERNLGARKSVPSTPPAPPTEILRPATVAPPPLRPSSYFEMPRPTSLSNTSRPLPPREAAPAVESPIVKHQPPQENVQEKTVPPPPPPVEPAQEPKPAPDFTEEEQALLRELKRREGSMGGRDLDEHGLERDDGGRDI